MSEYYYLDCKTHKEAIFITNNKGDPPEKESLKLFLIYHGAHTPSHGCEVTLESEHTIDYEHVKKCKETISKHLKEIEEIEAGDKEK